jgi:hypothetical protein
VRPAALAAAPVALALLLLTSVAEGAPERAGAIRAAQSRVTGRPSGTTQAGSGREGGAALHRAPTAPPLTSAAEGTGTVAEETDAGASPQGEVDPLVSNGLGSPLCKGALGGQELSSRSRGNCETSGFVAAASPTGNYGIDVHIDTGFLGISTGELLTTVQDLFVTPLWMALVWAVHALVVMLEWCFTIDLLDDPSTGLGSGLRQMQANITEPWLATVLAVASVLALYNGVIRRRVSDALGQALVAGAMMLGGLWVILDPTGTVGALGGWANQASLGTLAVSARGSPAGAGRALAGSMAALFASTIEVPWCYLEFGDVGWCRNPARLDPRLRTAGLNIASRELAQADCSRSSSLLASCVPAGSGPARALEHSAQLLRSARSNGAIFLALPANGPARNSINDESSLLRVMCQSSQATSCRGPMAAQAEFRTNRGTWKRVGGLLLIVAGVLGMLLLFGFIALRLLGAAIFSLLYLLLAPAAVLAPALGESGRRIFRRWAAQLLGAVLAKLLFAFLLGIVLAVLAILAALEALGWWTQWLLMSAFWWGAYGRRHQALSVAGGALGGERVTRPRSVARRAVDALPRPRNLMGTAWAIGGKLSKSPLGPEKRVRLERAGRIHARAAMDEQVQRSIEADHREARARSELLPQIQRQLSAKRTQLSRIERARADAVAKGDRRRTAELGHRAKRVEEELADQQLSSDAARNVPRAGARARAHAERRGHFLDAQAQLAGSARASSRGGERRDYAALAGLAGYGREEYERLDPRRQRVARMEVDRELALRREMRPAATDAARGADAKAARREIRQVKRGFDGALESRMRAGGHSMPASRSTDPIDRWVRAGRDSEPASASRESSVMRDAREVAMRRKRQLGRDRY